MSLCTIYTALKAFLVQTVAGTTSIDFSNPEAVIALNKALLMKHYGIAFWEIPDKNLCPPIPSRADYIHHLADLLGNETEINGIDIGVGANCIYPILGTSIYNWNFLGVDIADNSLHSAQNIVNKNKNLSGKIKLVKQEKTQAIFNGILEKNKLYHFSMCNPPFHSSKENATKAANKKIKNLQLPQKDLNFGGMANELWCKGGELDFLKRMVRESFYAKEQVLWFTSLVSKKENIRPLQVLLKKHKITQLKVIPMNHGNKQARIIAWSYQ